MKGYIVYPTYRIIDGRPVIHLYGRLDDRRSFAAYVGFSPYFYIYSRDAKKAEQALLGLSRSHGGLKSAKISGSGMNDFQGKPLSRVDVSVPPEVPLLKKELEAQGIACLEADIRFTSRFMIDNEILGVVDIEGDSRKADPGLGEHVDVVFESPKIRAAPQKGFPGTDVLAVISVDIETNQSATEIFSIALYGADFKRVLIVSDRKVAGAETYSDELSMLSRFRDLIIELDPDILTGWNFIDFDLNILQKRFRHHRVPFRLGRNDWDGRLRISRDYMRSSSADLPGRVVLDGINLLKTNFVDLESYSLEHTARTYLGRGKINISEPANRAKEILRMYKEDPAALAGYNLNDARLVMEILGKLNMIELTMQKSLVTGLSMDRVRGSVAALDMLYLKEARKRGIVCPSAHSGDSEGRIKGGFVMEPEFGIYENILVFDFKSLYPNIIRTFNIDPLTFDRKGLIKAPNGARFSDKEGILPGIIQSVQEKRDTAKKEGDSTRSYALKIIMNSFYGVMANPSCRFYNPKVAGAITAFARQIVKETAELIRGLGYRVIYGDTDSVFVVSGEKSPAGAERVAGSILGAVNEHYKKKVKEEAGRESCLELQFEKLYRRFMLPMIRGRESGAKKRYAGVVVRDDKEAIDIVGLEFVRRDWTLLAREFQMGLLERVFSGRDIEKYIRKIIMSLKDGELDDKLVYRKALRKGLGEYTKTTPPHVKAARLLERVESNIIEYYITLDGPQPVGMKNSQIDYRHYIEKQLKPIAESVLRLLGRSFEEVLGKTSQTDLASFGKR